MVAPGAHRRLLGGVVLGAALLVVAVLSVPLAPQPVGSPSRMPPPEPPPVGSCANLEHGGLRLVDCAEVHTVEVAHGWQAGTAGAPWPRAVEAEQECAWRAEEYVGAGIGASADGAWRAPLAVAAALHRGPGRRLVRQWSWRVCLVQPDSVSGDGYRGSVRALGVTGAVPQELRWCYGDPPGPGAAPAPARCSDPHRGELLAVRTLPPTDGTRAAEVPDDELFGRDCRQIAAGVTGLADPTHAGALAVRLVPPANSLDIARLAHLWCAIEAVGERRLTGSVAGLDGADPPLR